MLAYLEIKGDSGILFDAVYHPEFAEVLFKNIRKNKKINSGNGTLFSYKATSKKIKNLKEIDSKLVTQDHSNTLINYNDTYFLKLYRRLDTTINPDMEMCRYFTQKTNFRNTPEFLGGMEYQHGNRKITLGMMQKLIPHQENAWQYAKDSLDRYFENVLTRSKEKKLPKRSEELAVPVKYEKIPDAIKEFMGVIFPERISLLGERTAEMHLALSSNPQEPDFEDENFSLHYQRSLFSSLQSLTRNTLQNLQSQLDTLPENVREEAEEVISRKKDILKFFKRVYHHTIPLKKIRTHGNYHLNEVLWTGKDFVIIDFEGERARPFSERRLKRSALRDVASMVRSFHYVAYSSIMEPEYDRHRKEGNIEAWAEAWFYHVTHLFLQTYTDKADGSEIIPEEKEDFKLLMEIFMLEKAVYELNYELNNRPEWILIPLRGILSIIGKK